jgi:hypothetical protein
LSQADYHDDLHAIAGITSAIILCIIAIQASNPQTIDLFESSPVGRTELGQCVEIQSTVAKNTGFADIRQKQQLLHARVHAGLFGGECGLDDGSEDVDRLPPLLVRWNRNIMQDLTRGSSDVEIPVPCIYAGDVRLDPILVGGQRNVANQLSQGVGARRAVVGDGREGGCCIGIALGFHATRRSYVISYA